MCKSQQRQGEGQSQCRHGTWAQRRGTPWHSIARWHPPHIITPAGMAQVTRMSPCHSISIVALQCVDRQSKVCLSVLERCLQLLCVGRGSMRLRAATTTTAAWDWEARPLLQLPLATTLNHVSVSTQDTHACWHTEHCSK